MSKDPSEILRSEIVRGTIRPGDPEYAVWDTTGGLTDELREANIYKQLGNTYRMRDADAPVEPTVPTLKAVLTKLGIKAEDDPTGMKAAFKFYEDFPEKREVWKKKIEKDPAFGTRGWKTVQDLFKQVAIDKMNYDIAENRRNALYGLDENGNIEDPAGWALSRVASFIAPRSIKAYEAGREPTASEILRDAGSNALYALPFGTGVKALTVGAPAAVRGVANLASQAIAPSVVAGIDVLSDPDYTIKEGIADAGLGTLANLGINRLAASYLARKMAASQGAISRSPFMRAVREVLEDMPTLKEKAKETVKGAYAILVDATTSSAEKAAASDILEAAAALGKNSPLRGAAVQAVDDAAYVAKELAKSNKQALKASGLPVSSRGYDPARAVGQALDNAAREAGGAVPYSKILSQHPELVGLVKNDLAERLASPSNILKGYVVNIAGNNTPAAEKAGLDPKLFIELKKEAKEDKAAKASDALGKSGRSDLTEEDKNYLKMISENPKVLKFSQNDGFKIWLLKRGHRLLQGTPAHRPLWDVD